MVIYQKKIEHCYYPKLIQAWLCVWELCGLWYWAIKRKDLNITQEWGVIDNTVYDPLTLPVHSSLTTAGMMVKLEPYLSLYIGFTWVMICVNQILQNIGEFFCMIRPLLLHSESPTISNNGWMILNVKMIIISQVYEKLSDTD